MSELKSKTPVLSVRKQNASSLDGSFFHTWSPEQVAEWLTIYDHDFLVPYFKDMTGKQLYSWFNGDVWEEKNFAALIPDHINVSSIFTLLETLTYYQEPCVRVQVGSDIILVRNGALSLNDKVLATLPTSSDTLVRSGSANILTGEFNIEPITF